MKMFTCKFAQDEVTHQRLRVGSKKSVQQGRSHFYARSVCVIREHGKMARTPLAAFFNRPMIGIKLNCSFIRQSPMNAERFVYSPFRHPRQLSAGNHLKASGVRGKNRSLQLGIYDSQILIPY